MFIRSRRAFPKCFMDGDQGGGGGLPAPANPIAGALGAGAPVNPANPANPAAPAGPWYSSLTDPVAKEMMAARGYDTPEKLASSYVAQNRALNGAKDVVAVPPENATPEQLNAFYSKLGKPASPDGYTFKFENGFTPDEGFMKAAQGFFHGAHLSPQQAQAVVNGWQKYITTRTADDQRKTAEAIQASLTKTQTELGAGFEAAKQRGNTFLSGLGLSQDNVNWLAQNGGAPAVVELLARIGSKLSGEGTLVQGGAGGAADPSQMSAAQAQEAINVLNKDPEFQKAYFDKKHDNHKAAVERMQALFLATTRKPS